MNTEERMEKKKMFQQGVVGEREGEEVDSIIDEFLKQQPNNYINTTNNATMNNVTSGYNDGLSIFGDDETNDGDESLLLSPILNDYIGKNAHVFTNAFTSPSSGTTTSSSSSFMSPTIHNNTNTYSTANATSTTSIKTPTTTTTNLTLSSSTLSKSNNVRSSARLRRRKQVVFSSPREEQFRLEEEEEDNNNDNKIAMDNDTTTTMDDEKEHDYGKTSNLLRGALDTSLCPSLGLGSSIDEDDDDEDDDEDRKSYFDNNIDAINADDNNNNDNQQNSSKRGSTTSISKSASLNGSKLNISAFDSDCQSEPSHTSTSCLDETVTFNEHLTEKNKNDDFNIQKEDVFTTIINEKDHIEESFIDEGICIDNISSSSSDREHENELIEDTEEQKYGEESILEDASIDNDSEIILVNHDDDDDGVQTRTNLPTTDEFVIGKIAAHDYDDKDELESSINLPTTDEIDRGNMAPAYNILDHCNESPINDKHSTSTKADATIESSKLALSTPERTSSSHKKRFSLNLTPQFQAAARQTLTPVLNALRSKLMKSRQHHDESDDINGVEMMDQRNDDFSVKNNDTIDEEELSSFPTFHQNENEIEDPLVANMQSSFSNQTSKVVNGYSLNGKSLGSNEILTNQDSKTPGKQHVLNEMENENDNNTPELDSTPSLSLTPALKALRSKLLLGKSSTQPKSSQKLMDFTVSPIGNMSPNTIDEASPYRGSLFSPQIHEPLPHKTPNNNESNITEDDSYLAQPKDLNSAKKNLNAQSSALVTRLRGAAQRRMVDLTKKRDSLAAKEVQQLERMENKLNQAVSTIPEEDSVEGKSESSEKKSKSSKIQQENAFKARPLPASSKGGSTYSGVPKVSKKPVTKAISPKLGYKRSKNIKDVNVKQKDFMSKKDDPFHISPFKARPLPTFRNNYDKENRVGVPKIKKRQPTVPLSPLLGLRRTNSKKDGKVNSTSRSTIQTKETISNSPMSSIDPVGLGFLANTPTTTDQRDIQQFESLRRFCTHSAKRAEDRARFNEALSLRDKEREKQKRIEMESLIKQRLRELESMKQYLR